MPEVERLLGGRWKLERLIGAGGSARVYAARHRNGRPVAVKVLHEELSRRPRVVRRFLAEGYAANKVPHRSVVAVLDDGREPDGTTYLVMELLEGRPLARVLESDGPLSVIEVARAGIEILEVLAAAHDAGILHRDIKPSNVFQTDAGAIKVLDFGAARVREADDFVTRSGTTIGTPSFMAPELAAGRTEDVDPRTDLWAVAATMFQLLTGRTVHEARSSNHAIVMAATRPVPPLASVAPALPSALVAILERALAFEMRERWPNARAMRAALLAEYPQAAPPAGTEFGRSSWRRGARSARRAAWILAGSCAALSAGAWAVGRESASSTAGPAQVASASPVLPGRSEPVKPLVVTGSSSAAREPALPAAGRVNSAGASRREGTRMTGRAARGEPSTRSADPVFDVRLEKRK
jgi:eukaryotic-like serine/threonine-protein kinase